MEFDEINTIGTKRRSEEYTEYFSDMDLTEEQKQERVSFSEDTEEVLLFLMALFAVMIDFDNIDEEMLTETLTMQFRAVVVSYMGTTDEYIDLYIQNFANDFIRATIDNLDNEWYLSNDRAMFDSENEANTVLNYKDYLTAIASGKTQKTWITYGDNRVRKTHRRLDGKTIPIKSLFEVGDSFMRFPKDTKYFAKPSEIIGCRCSTSYS